MTALRACAGFVVLVVLTMASQLCVAQETVPGWHSSLEDARKLAESTGKPLFITFRCVR
jgi:hypothetical protein